VVSEVKMLDRALLGCLEAAWSVQGAPIAGNTTLGLSDEEMDEITVPLGLRLPLEARVWWGWHDGVSRGAKGELAPERWIGPIGEYLPLRDAVEVYLEERKIFADILEGDPESCRPAAYLPVTYGTGPILCDCSVPAGAPSPIYYTHTHAPPELELAEPRAGSFGEMVSWWIDALTDGGWHWDAPKGRWLVHHEKIDEKRASSGLM
jgi:hypothetical protein